MLEGKVVLVTGGAAGQGRAHVLQSVREGARVIAVDIHAEDSDVSTRLADEVGDLGGEVLIVQANVTDQKQLDSAVSRGLKRFGRLDAVIVNAGIYRGGTLVDVTDADWQLVLDVNLTGALKTIKATAPALIDADGASVVVIASIDGIHPLAGSTAYAVSKAAVISLAKNAAIELGSEGVRVNVIAPGYVDTDMLNSQGFYDRLAGGEGLGTRQHLLDYGATKAALKGASVIPAEEIAKVALFLNSELAASMTGAVLPVDAGHLLLPHAKKS